MGAIARSELGQDGLHVSFDGIFRHSEKLPNTFVRASYRYQAQDVELTRRNLIFGKMARELEGHRDRDTKFADVRTSNRVYQVTTQHVLQKVTHGSRPKALRASASPS